MGRPPTVSAATTATVTTPTAAKGRAAGPAGRSRAPRGAQLSRERRRLLDALDTLTADRLQTPCQATPEPFTSDDPDARAAAATACGRCPVQAECNTYAVTAREPFGVWGGRDRSP